MIVCTLPTLPLGVWHVSIAFTVNPLNSSCVGYYSLGTSTTNVDNYHAFSLYTTASTNTPHKITDVISQRVDSQNWYLIGKSNTKDTIYGIYIVCNRIA